MLSVVIPAYNEVDRLPGTLAAVHRHLAGRSYEVIVVDDGSSDGTARVIKKEQLVSLPFNMGKGGAVRAGVLSAAGDRILVMDADLAVPMSELEKLLLAGETVAASPPELQEAASGTLTLTAGHLIPAEADKGFDQLGMVAMNQATAHRVSSFFGSGSFKKVTLINEANGETGTFPVMVVNDDENRYDGMAILCRAIEKKLDAKAGEPLRVEI